MCPLDGNLSSQEELKQYMYADSLADLKLDESGKIGYTYKCMGSGFWSLRQNDFRASLEAIAYEVIYLFFIYLLCKCLFSI